MVTSVAIEAEKLENCKYKCTKCQIRALTQKSGQVGSFIFYIHDRIMANG